tara:strand:+ start:191 stop:457 length:267 start_codon:yes stop_codon:yes gene_type:complete
MKSFDEKTIREKIITLIENHSANNFKGTKIRFKERFMLLLPFLIFIVGFIMLNHQDYFHRFFDLVLISIPLIGIGVIINYVMIYLSNK